MNKKVAHIEVPKEWEITNDWDSHRPMLWLACEKTKGIDGYRIEMGCGEGSTNMLNEYYNDRKKFDPNTLLLSGEIFMSYETNKSWADKFPYVLFCKDYSCAIDCVPDAAFVFIDCAPAELRKDIINCITDKAKIIIIHDTEESAEYVYGLKEILSTFKYRLDFKPEGLPHTTAISNFVDVEGWYD